MLRNLWDKLTRPQAETEDERLREYMTRVVLSLSLGSILVFTVFIAVGWIAGAYDAVPVIVMGLMIMALGTGLYATYHGRWHWGGIIPPLAFYLLALYGTYNAGIVATTVLLYPLAILLTAMLFNQRAQVIMVLLSIVTHIGVGLARTPESLESIIPPAITISGSLVGLALLLLFFANQLQRALASTRAYGAVMKEYRDHLEDLVKTRTSDLKKVNEDLQSEIADREKAQEALRIAHDQLEIRVQERTAELSIMLEAAKAVSSTLELHNVLHEIAKQMVMAIGVTSCSLCRYEKGEEAVVHWAEWRRDNFISECEMGSKQLLDDFPSIHAVIMDRKPIVLDKKESNLSPNDVEIMRKLGAEVQLLLPLQTADQVIGLAILGETNAGREFTQNDIKLCEALADQAAVTIENAYLHAETKRRSQRLSALHNIDMAISASLDLSFTLNVLLEQIITHLGVDAAAVLINDLNQNLKFAAGRGFRSSAIERTIVRMGEGYPGMAALKRRLLKVPDMLEIEQKWSRPHLITDEEFKTYHVVPLIAKGEVMGVLEIFHRDYVKSDMEWVNFLETLAGQAAIAIHNSDRLEKLERAKTELEVAYSSTLEAWIETINQHLGESIHQTHLMMDLTLQLAHALNLPGDKLIHVSRGALLHDIGMIAVPESILRKSGPLKAEERAIVEQHPNFAFQILSKIPYLEAAVLIPYCHHERWDGCGYPRGLEGGEIPLEARIFSVVDVWNALNTERPYRPAWPIEKTRAYIEEQAGFHFDPMVVATFLELQPHATVPFEKLPVFETETEI